jgi:hypothetical protein
MSFTMTRSCDSSASAPSLKLRSDGFLNASRICGRAIWVSLLAIYFAAPVAAQLSVGGVYGIAGPFAASAVEGFDHTKWRRAPTYGAAVEYRFKSGLSLGVRAERLDMKMREDAYELGSLKISPMLATIGYQILPAKGKRFGGYVRFGAGTGSTKFTNGPDIKNLIGTSGVKLDVSVDKPILFDIGGGIDYFLIRQISITGDFRLLMSNIGTKWRMSYGSVYTYLEDVDNFYASTGQAAIGVRLWLRK